MSTRMRTGWLLGAWLTGVLLLWGGGAAGASPVGTLIPAANRWDMVYDETRDIVYITNGNQILRYRIATNTFLTPYDCGGGALLTGIDLSPDRRFLIACDDSYNSTTTWIRVVDLTTDTVSRQDFPRFYGEAGTFAVAFGYDGVALITGRYAGSGWLGMRKYCPATGVFSPYGSVRQDTMPCASADGSIIGLAQENDSGGEWDCYRVSDGHYACTGNTGSFIYEIGVNRNGTQYAVPTFFGTYVYNATYGVIATMGSYGQPQPIAAAFHPSKDIIYFPWTSSTTIRAYRTTDFALLGVYDFGYTFGTTGNHAFAQGRTKIARDGSYIFCTVPGGVRYASATVPTVPTSLAVDKPSPKVGDNVAATAAGSFAPTGLPLSYVYDWSKLLSAGQSAAKASGRVARKQRSQSVTQTLKGMTQKAWGDYSGAVLPGSQTTKGDQWQVRARATDGTSSSDWLEGPVVTIGNTPPSAPGTLTLTPLSPSCASTLQATAGGATDADGDTPLTYQYQWAKWTGSAWGAWGNTCTDGILAGVALHKADRWRVQARAFDGTNYGPFVSTPVSVTIANTLPSVPAALVVDPPEPVYNSTLDATADGATDADGDTLSYQYQWQRWDGTQWSAWGYTSTDGTVPHLYLMKGNRWRVQARAYDGTGYGPFVTTPVEVTVQDSAPSAPTALTISPAIPVCTDVLSATASGSTDPNIGDAAFFKYQWSKQSVDGSWGAWGHDSTDGKLTSVALHNQDVWRVHACATDGTLDSAWSDPVQVTVGDTAPGVPATLTIAPTNPLCTSQLVATAGDSTDPDAEIPTYKYEWSKLGGESSSARNNGSKLLWGDWGHASTDGELIGVTLTKGDTWRVHACATDGTLDSAWSEPVQITIGNSAPHGPRQLTIAPTDPVCASSLVATADGSTDPDTGDAVSYKYQWALLGAAQSGARKSLTWGYDSTDGALTGVTLHKGEVWQVHACATDGTLDSEWTDPVEVTIGNSAPATPTQLTISPAAPLCTSSLVATADGSTDPDTGDAVSCKYQWALVTAQSGARKSLTWGYDSTDGALTGVTLHKGEVWQVHACATDGTLDSAWTEPVQTTVQDTLPTMSQVVLTPSQPRTLDNLTATPSASDADGDGLTYEIQWARWTAAAGWGGWNDTGAVLDNSKTTKGERWKAQARAFDGTGYSEWVESAEVEIGNTPPGALASLTISPLYPKTADDLRVVTGAAQDADGDPLTYACQWSSRAGEGQAWSAWVSCGRVLNSTLTARGEQWRVRCRASDGVSSGPWLISNPVTVLNTRPTPPATVTIAPTTPGADVDLVATAGGGTDADLGDTVTYEYKWRRSFDGGVTWSSWYWNGATLSKALTSKGQKWQVMARATDGTLYTGWRAGAIVTILRAAPAAPALAMTATATAAHGGLAQVTVSLSAAAQVQARVLNLAGREVALLNPQTLSAGVQTLLWNGRSSAGTPAPPGQYLVEVLAQAASGGTTCCIVPLVR